jgi:hypothetical protein
MRTLRRVITPRITWITLIILSLALVLLTMQLRSSQNQAATMRKAMGVQATAIESNREALRELCRTNGILAGLVAEGVALRKRQLKAGMVPKPLEERWRLDILILNGYQGTLAEQTACAEITKP